MKYIICLFTLLAFLGSCKKKSSPSPVVSYSNAQIIDSLNIQYEHKYWVKYPGNPAGVDVNDTIVFHPDSTITEIHCATNPYLHAPISYRITPIYYQDSSIGNLVLFEYAMVISPLIDTANGFVLHDNLIGKAAFLTQKFESSIYFSEQIYFGEISGNNNIQINY